MKFCTNFQFLTHLRQPQPGADFASTLNYASGKDSIKNDDYCSVREMHYHLLLEVGSKQSSKEKDMT